MVCSNSHQQFHTVSTNRRASSSSNDDVARMYNIIGNAHFDQNNYHEAIDAYHRGLEIELGTYEPTHPNVVVTLCNMGEAYRESGNYHLALQLYDQVLSIQEKAYGTEAGATMGVCHRDICTTIQSIAIIYDQMGQLELALSYIEYTLAMQRQFHSSFELLLKKNCNTAADANLRNFSVTVTHAGCILVRMGKISTAMSYFKEALSIQQQAQNCMNDETAFTLYNIAHCHQMNGSYSEAIHYYTETLKLEEELSSSSSMGKYHHQDSSATRFKLGEVYSAIGDLDNALIHFQGALQVERSNTIFSSSSSRDDDGCSSSSFNESKILIEIGYIHYFQGNHGQLLDTLRQISELDTYCPDGLDKSIKVMYESLQKMMDSSRMAAAAA